MRPTSPTGAAGTSRTSTRSWRRPSRIARHDGPRPVRQLGRQGRSIGEGEDLLVARGDRDLERLAHRAATSKTSALRTIQGTATTAPPSDRPAQRRARAPDQRRPASVAPSQQHEVGDAQPDGLLAGEVGEPEQEAERRAPQPRPPPRARGMARQAATARTVNGAVESGPGDGHQERAEDRGHQARRPLPPSSRGGRRGRCARRHRRPRPRSAARRSRRAAAGGQLGGGQRRAEGRACRPRPGTPGSGCQRSKAGRGTASGPAA